MNTQNNAMNEAFLREQELLGRRIVGEGGNNSNSTKKNLNSRLTI